MTRITTVRLREIIDSRGNPTVEADVLTESGGFGRAAAPAGASTGEHEAVSLEPAEAIAKARDHAVPQLLDETFAGNQREVDRTLRAADGTDDFSTIGANSAVAISMAAAKAGADVLGAPLFQHLGGALRGENFPIPLGNVVGGGEHAADATDIQEVLVAPVGAPNVTDAVFANAAVHAEVAELLDERGEACGKGDEGAWAPSIDDREALDLVAEAVSRVVDEFGFGIGIGLDVAAAELYDPDEGVYEYSDTTRDTDEQIAYMADLVDEYDLVYLEDPLDENDFEAWVELTDAVGEQTTVCGDDLFVTNTDRLVTGIDRGAANSILIKPNQIGTLTDAVDAIDLARNNGYDPVISHRSGETEDTTIAHLAVATAAPYIKTGAVGGERTAKLNELIRIADDAT